MCEETQQKQIGLGVEKRESLNVGNGESPSISLISHSSCKGPEQYWDLGYPYTVIWTDYLRVIEAKFHCMFMALQVGC